MARGLEYFTPYVYLLKPENPNENNTYQLFLLVKTNWFLKVASQPLEPMEVDNWVQLKYETSIGGLLRSNIYPIRTTVNRSSFSDSAKGVQIIIGNRNLSIKIEFSQGDIYYQIPPETKTAYNAPYVYLFSIPEENKYYPNIIVPRLARVLHQDGNLDGNDYIQKVDLEAVDSLSSAIYEKGFKSNQIPHYTAPSDGRFIAEVYFREDIIVKRRRSTVNNTNADQKLD